MRFHQYFILQCLDKKIFATPKFDKKLVKCHKMTFDFMTQIFGHESKKNLFEGLL